MGKGRLLLQGGWLRDHLSGTKRRAMETIGKLRPIDDSELELIRSWRNTPDVRANMYNRHEIAEEEHRAWWARCSQSSDREYFMYALSDVPLGVVGFTAIDRVNSNSLWGFYASPEAPKGTGVRMLFLAAECLFSDFGLHKIYSEVLDFNISSIKLHQRLGFQVEGVFRHQHKVDGSYVDIYRLGLLAEEWREVREAVVRSISSFNSGG